MSFQNDILVNYSSWHIATFRTLSVQTDIEAITEEIIDDINSKLDELYENKVV